ncbi:MAG: 50S ribosomal protein L35 [Deltaproteobacteria bacterium]|nr:50S ribosomal protein L35 [Deltaproteobacteria bacterium]
MAKIKIKTRKSAQKRFRKTASGKFKRAKANRRHILSAKPPKRMRQLRTGGMVHPADQKQVARMLPN